MARLKHKSLAENNPSNVTWGVLGALALITGMGLYLYVEGTNIQVLRKAKDAIENYGKTVYKTTFMGPSLSWDSNRIETIGNHIVFYCTLKVPPVTSLLGVGKDKVSYPLLGYDTVSGQVINRGVWK